MYFSVQNSRARIAICYSKSLSCYSELNLDGKFHAKIAIHLFHIKLKTLYIYILEYYIIIIDT